MRVPWAVLLIVNNSAAVNTGSMYLLEVEFSPFLDKCPG